MKTTIDYSDRPAAAFDAVEDIKTYLGPAKYQQITREMAKVTNKDRFAFYCSLAGIHGFPVKAWYDHYHGQGAWDKDNG